MYNLLQAHNCTEGHNKLSTVDTLRSTADDNLNCQSIGIFKHDEMSTGQVQPATGL